MGNAAETAGTRYKWIALINTTIGVLMVTISGSITLISLPDIFRGIHLNPLAPGNTSYFLWLLMGFLLVTAVLVVSFGRVGDMFGRVKMYNLGFAVFTFFSILLSVTWMSGIAGALWLIIMRVFQGVGGAFLFANSSAIITDAFPENQRGMALGINGVAAIAGSFLGLLIAGCWRPSSGGWCSWSACPSGCSARSGPTPSWWTTACASRPRSIGRATSLSVSG